jgi:hypothetical protein
MIKIPLIAIIAVTLCACETRTGGDGLADAADFQIIRGEIKNNDAAVLATGSSGDTIVKLKETKALKAIANKEKDGMFMSAEILEQYVSDGFCLVNVIPAETMKALGADMQCYRLFCGSWEDIGGKLYSVERCGDLAK